MNLLINRLKSTGFFHVFSSNVLNQIIAFCSSIILVRILNKNDFGLFSYANNIVTMFMLFNGLGSIAGILQFCSENRGKNPALSIAYFKYGLGIGLKFNILLVFLIICYALFINTNNIEVSNMLIIMSLIPIIQFISEAQQVYLRFNLMNKEFSYINTTQALLLFIGSFTGALLFQIYGLLIFRYIAYVCTILVGFKITKILYILLKSRYKLNKEEKSQFISFSITATINNAISHLLYVIDIFLIGIIIGNTNIIASYKTATLIPFALNFIPMAIITYIYPYFSQKNEDKQWIKKNYLRLIKILGIVNFTISAFLFYFAPFIIKYIFGSEYMDALVPFRILAIGYFFAGTFRIITGNIIVMIKKIKFNFYLSIVTGLLNIVLNILLISYYGSIGAAISTVIIIFLTSLFSTIFLFRWMNAPVE